MLAFAAFCASATTLLTSSSFTGFAGAAGAAGGAAAGGAGGAGGAAGCGCAYAGTATASASKGDAINARRRRGESMAGGTIAEAAGERKSAAGQGRPQATGSAVPTSARSGLASGTARVRRARVLEPRAPNEQADDDV